MSAPAAEKLATIAEEELADLRPEERVALVGSLFPDAVFTTSLGLEDQLLTALIARHAPHLPIVTLQTGRLFEETLSLIAQTEATLGVAIQRLEPDAADVATYEKRYGRDGFYDSVEARHACCFIRKVKLLDRALGGVNGWITGLRREQSGNRMAVPFREWDNARQLVKFNLLADLSRADMLAMIEKAGVPVNPLHARGYPSIGCAPCTRAIKPGEDERAGRWWWERDDKRECGLHVA